MGKPKMGLREIVSSEKTPETREMSTITGRYVPKSSSRSTKKCALGEKKAKGDTGADAGPVPVPTTDLKQTAGADINLKAKKKTAKLFSTSRKEESASQKSTLRKTGQSSNICQKTSTDKDISHKEKSRSPVIQKGTISKVNVDPFTFSYPERLAPSKTSAMKQAVLRTIAKMVEENKDIRRRLMSCRQGNNTGTEWINKL
ncbi:hypothetical protein AAFF_G00309190 [Aldrovandia affinis]|uniref:Uncharacterized protein n=1 Tax=Aldrovandia affinis TaxID=143900 RepID=A0AAD7WQT9_9TELE|nr:hypothetical protein AAFF_G00309190 [Aldrovandia affinis]